MTLTTQQAEQVARGLILAAATMISLARTTIRFAMRNGRPTIMRRDILMKEPRQ